jgi:hypothetical protein
VKGEPVSAACRLTPVEVGAAFDLPLLVMGKLEHVGLESDFARCVLSGCLGKVLQEILEFAVPCLATEVVAPAGHQGLLCEDPIRRLMDMRETPKDERSLPPWVMVCTHNLKAVKANGVKPNIAMWDLQVQECCHDLTDEFLATFRELLMVGCWRRCYKSLCRYLSMEYGPSWLESLCRARRAKSATKKGREP